MQITSLPIWVKFFNIPLEYRTVTSLGYIASVVGIPIHLDTLTENHSRLSFARICIEVDVISQVDFLSPNQSTASASWIPRRQLTSGHHCRLSLDLECHSHHQSQRVPNLASPLPAPQEPWSPPAISWFLLEYSHPPTLANQ